MHLEVVSFACCIGYLTSAIFGLSTLIHLWSVYYNIACWYRASISCEHDGCWRSVSAYLTDKATIETLRVCCTPFKAGQVIASSIQIGKYFLHFNLNGKGFAYYCSYHFGPSTRRNNIKLFWELFSFYRSLLPHQNWKIGGAGKNNQEQISRLQHHWLYS